VLKVPGKYTEESRRSQEGKGGFFTRGNWGLGTRGGGGKKLTEGEGEKLKKARIRQKFHAGRELGAQSGREVGHGTRSWQSLAVGGEGAGGGKKAGRCVIPQKKINRKGRKGGAKSAKPQKSPDRIKMRWRKRVGPPGLRRALKIFSEKICKSR